MLVKKLTGSPRNNAKWRADPKAVPPEVWEKYGDFTIQANNGYLYATIRGSRKPQQFKHTERIAISKLVYLIHNPGHRFAPFEQIRYCDRDKQNNTIENLMARGDK